MSITDPNADDVQPDAGQGDGGQGNPAYAEYLSRIPEEAREPAEEAFKAWDANYTRHQQEAAEFRKQWEPLAETGVNQLSPEQVSYAVQLFQAMDDPQVMKQWWEGYAQQNGLTPAQTAELQSQTEAPPVDEFGFQDPSQQFQKMLDEKLSPLAQQVEQFSQWQAQQAQQAAEADALRIIEGQVATLEQKHGAFDEGTKELINTLAGRYIESDPMNAIPRAYEDLTRWRNEIEKSTLQGKVDAPAPAETGGIPDVAPETHSRIDSPGVKDAALEFLRNSNRG